MNDDDSQMDAGNRSEAAEPGNDGELPDDLVSFLRSLAQDKADDEVVSRKVVETDATEPGMTPMQPRDRQSIGKAVHLRVEQTTPFLSPSERRLLSTLRGLAAWGLRFRNAKYLQDLLVLTPNVSGSPKNLAEQWLACGDLLLSDLADSELLSVTLDDLADTLLAVLDGQRRVVFMRRIVEGCTLDEVGQELGVTRERVRQVQQDVERRLAVRLHSRPFLLLQWCASDLRRLLGVAAPVDHENTITAFSEVFQGASSKTETLLRPLVLQLAGPYRERDGWLLVESAAPRNAEPLHEQCDEFGLMPISRAYDWLTDSEISADFQDEWLERFGRLRRFEDTLVAWPRNVVDKCVALLALRNEPADAATLVELVGEGHNVRGVQSRFSDDERLIRVNKTDWALRAWGMEEYTGITDEIAQRIEEAGGLIDLEEVIRVIAKQFNLSEGSVGTFSNAPMFVIEESKIRLRRDDEPFDVGKGLSDARGAYRVAADQISLLLTVDKEVVRGSGRPLNPAVALELGVKPGGRRLFQYENGELTISWPLTSAFGPSLGSIRVLVERAGALKGERVRLDFNLEDEQVDAERVPIDLSDVDTTEALRLLTGIQADAAGGALAVARAVDSPPANVRGVLKERGDTEALELLPSVDIDPLLESTLSDLATAILGE